MTTPVTINLAQQLRPAGATTFGPATIPAGYTSCKVQINLPKLDFENPTTSLDANFEWNDGAQWLLSAAMHFNGGASVGKGGVVDPAPATTIEIFPAMVGKQIRSTVTIATPTTYGATLTLT